MSIQIIDVHPGAALDIEYEKAIGTDGVILKAGQGHLEYKWRERAEACEQAGLPWGVYWLVDARYDPEGHKRAIKTAFPDGYFGKLGIWLDCEKPVMVMPDAIYRRLPYAYYKSIESIAQGIISYSGRKPGIYTSPGAYKLCFGIVPEAKQEWFSTLMLWTAQYKNSEADLYGRWTKYTFRQYQEGPDYSVFNGSEQEYRQLFGLDANPPPVPPPAPDRPKVTISVRGDVEVEVIK